MDAVINSALVICQRNAAEARARMPIADPKPDHWRDADAELLRTAEIFVECKPEWFRKDFGRYIRENWSIYKAFEREANAVWARGKRRYSQRTIWEVLRHESAAREHASDWKLNDWYLKDIARLYVCMHQDKDGLFEFRNGQSAVRSA